MAKLLLWSESELGRLKRRMDSMFDHMCSELGLPDLETRGDFSHHMTSDNERLVIHTKLPGLKPEDMELTVTDRFLVISGRVVERHPGASSFRSVHREIHLPCRVDPAKVTASLENGVLTVTLPKCGDTIERIRILEK